MCTVTYIPINQKVYITSNRDEKVTRKRALPPCVIAGKHGWLMYPVDADKGGSWIVTRQGGDVAVLLNGAKHAHVSLPFYRQSRGLLLLSIMQHKHPLQYLNNTSLDGIEPFTLILYVRKQLHECRWDGTLLSIVRLNADQAYIWSSSTLYTPSTIEKRNTWFANWLAEKRFTIHDDIICFHKTAGDGDEENDVLMNRHQQTYTVSITSVVSSNSVTTMSYYDVVEDKAYQQQMNTNTNTLIQKQWFDRFYIRLRHWEYWPFYIVYIPVYFYWFWLCLKARSFFFFSAANPTIRNGGFLMESKKEIYDLLPPGTYPQTVIKKHDDNSAITDLINSSGLTYPIIAKPDIGLRGMGVALVNNEEELMDYDKKSQVDYLLQELISYPNEVGIFYYRLPGIKKGKITGIVGKAFLKVTGDGSSTMLQLLMQEERYRLQIPSLKNKYQSGLSEVLKAGEERLLVPFGNHSRGAMFIDLTHQLNDELSETFDTLCRRIKGFYFGRLDIKYDNWQDLCAGKNFSIIELNGAGSEPAHIYDPKHSILYAWKEIIRHLGYLYQVSKRNRSIKKTPYLTIKEGLKMFRDNSKQVEKIA